MSEMYWIIQIIGGCNSPLLIGPDYIRIFSIFY